MMKQKRICGHLFNLCCLCAILLSCQPADEIKIEEVHPRLVLNARLQQDSVITTTVSRSQGSISEVYPAELYIDNARVELYVNGENKGLMTKDGATGTYRMPACTPAAGDEIRLEASAEGYEAVSAVTSVPRRPEILAVDTQWVSIDTTGWNNNVIDFSLRFRTTPGRTGKYLFFVEEYVIYRDSVHSIQSLSPYVTHKEDLLFEDAYLYLPEAHKSYPIDCYLFTDETLGDEYTIHFTVSGLIHFKADTLLAAHHCDIHLQALSDSYYLYLRSKALQWKQEQDIFGDIGLREPIPTYTNIINGYGLLFSREDYLWRLALP